jgi:predicted amino acid dehydrogenase
VGNERVNIDVKNIEKDVANVTEATMHEACVIMKGIEKYIKVWEVGMVKMYHMLRS